MQIIIPDVSRWQGLIDFNELKNHVQGVIIKISGGDGGLYRDSMGARNRDEARRVGLPVWFYHYKGGGDPRPEAEYMLAAIGGLRDGEAIMLDDENEVRVNSPWSSAFADVIKEHTGLNEIVYSNLARLQGTPLLPLKDRNIGAIVAKYGSNNGSVAGAGSAPDGIDLPIIGWQYTSAARVPGITENSVDLSLFYGDVAAFKGYGVKGNVPSPAMPAAIPETALAAGDGTYLVKANDTLSKIGADLGIDWRVIAATNGIVAPYTIFPNQRLKVYGGTATQAATVETGNYMVVANDTLSGIGAKTGHDWKSIADLNGISSPYTIYPGQSLKLPGGGVAPVAQTVPTYTVVSGDYLSTIGPRVGVDWRTIASLNGIGAPYTIYPNQVLKLR